MSKYSRAAAGPNRFAFSTECERKESAEKFPKNFALIRLAEKARATPKKVTPKQPIRTMSIQLDQETTSS
jgi:hypothetical protein